MQNFQNNVFLFVRNLHLMFQYVSTSWGECITGQHLTIPFPCVPCAAPKVSSNESGSSTKPSSHRGASSANAVTWRLHKVFVVIFSGEMWWLMMFPLISWKVKILMILYGVKYVFYCLQILSLSLTFSNWISHLLHCRQLYGRCWRPSFCIHLVAPFLPVQRWMPQPCAARHSIATLLQLSQEFQQGPPSSQHSLPSLQASIPNQLGGGWGWVFHLA